MKYTININQENIGKSKYWALVKNYTMMLRLKRAEKTHFWYNMPYGGMVESNSYNLYSIDYHKN